MENERHDDGRQEQARLRGNERSSLEIGKLPRLRVVHIDALLLHEEPDPRRLASLEERISSDGHIRNPPIAARDHGSASHILLDGVNRVEALRNLGVEAVAVQEVDLDDPRLILSTWHHAVEGLDIEPAVERLSALGRVTPADFRLTPRGDYVPPTDRQIACAIVLPRRVVRAVRIMGGAEEALDAMQDVVRFTQHATNRDRVSYTNLPDLQEHYPNLTALICYRSFSKTELFELATKQRRVPSGITRFSVPKRALSLMVPLSLLKQSGSLEEKEEVLYGLVLQKVREKRIRFYEEPTFYFDE